MKYLSIQTFQCGISVSGLATFTGGAEINILSLNGATTSSEASLFLGAHSSLEGGQLVLQKGTGQTYAAHLDNYSDQFRVLFGTNTGSAGVAMSINLATRQLTLPTYTSTSSFPGTVAGYLAFDSVGNIITTSLALSGYVPTSRTLTINGTSYDLSADRTWTINTVDYTSRLQHQVKAGVAINKGQAVYVTSADGTNMIVGLASNASEATSSKTMGLLDATVSTNGFANVVTEGLLAGLDTTAAGAEGDPVWLGTGGNLIYGLANKPYAPAHLVFIGIVTRKNANNGEIFVKVQNGFELKEIHDVDLITNAPTAGQLLRYNSDGLWKNWSPNYLTAEADTLATVTGRDATTNTSITVGPDLIVQADGSVNYTASRLWLNSHNNYRGAGVHMSGVGSTWFAGTPYTDFDGGYVIARTGTSNDVSSAQYSNALLTVKSNGNVGIGTTNPTYKLDVNGSIRTSGVGGLNIDASANFGDNSGANFDILNLGSTRALRILATSNNGWGNILLNVYGGNVGIGTTSPSYKLQVNADGAGLYVLGANTAPYTQTIASFVYGGNSNSINIENQAGKASIQARAGGSTMDLLLNPVSGNVGIGTGSPIRKLHVNGDVQVDTNLAVSSGIYNTNYYAGSATATYFKNSVGTDTLTILQSGNVGIGIISPTNRLQIGSIGSSGYGGNDLAIGNGTQVMAFYQSSTVSTWYTNTSFSLMPSGSGSVGNLGIGTTSPSQLLHVAGNIRVTGAFYDSNNQAGTSGQILKSTGIGTDWVSLSEITGVDGTGTANYLAKWSDADTITNSLIYDNGTSVTINATSGGIYLNSNIGFGGPVNINDQFKFYYGQLQGNGNAYFTTYLNVGTSSNLGATLNVRGAGATSATKSLYIPNSDDSRTLSYTDDGKLTLSNGTYTTKWYIGSSYSPTLEFSAQGNITWGNGAIFRFYSTGDTTDYRLENGTFHTNHSQARFYAGSSGYLGFETIGSTTAYDAIGAVFTDNNTVSLRFFYKNTGSDIEGMRLTSSGNFLIGTTTNAGYKLDVNGTLRNISSVERGFRTEHTNGNNIEFVVGNGSAIGTGNGAMYFNGTPYYSFGGSNNIWYVSVHRVASAASVFQIYGGGSPNSTLGDSIYLGSNSITGGAFTATSGTQNTVSIGVEANAIWKPTSGNATYNLLTITPRIETSGTYSGTVRGLYINPTLTSITGATIRAIETTSGDVIFNNGELSVSDTGTSGVTHNLLFRNDNNSYGGIYISSTGQSLSIQQNSGYGYLAAAGFSILSANGGIWTNNGSVFRVVDSGGTINYFRIHDTTGNVSINSSTDAGYKLDVNGTVRFGDLGNVYYATLTSGGADGGIFRVGGASYGYAQLQSYALTLNGGHGISGTGGTAQFSITSQVSPSAAQSNAAIRFVADNPGSGGGTWGAYSTALAFNFLKKETSGSYTSILAMNGGTNNVGIGTINPAFTLVVKQPSNSTATGLQITQTDSASDGMVLQFISSVAIIKNRTTGALTLGTNDTERFRITAGGDIGIGTTSPSYKLDINGSFRSIGTADIVSNFTFHRLNSANQIDIDSLDSFILSKTDGSYGSGTKPSGSHNGFGVISLQTHAGNYFTQLGLDTNQNDLWIRSANGTAPYGAWVKMWNTDDFSSSNISNWNTAYGWGNHSSAGYVPQTRTLTINGTSYDLSANRSWTIATTTPGGSDTQFQYNSSGSLAGASALTYNSANNRIGVNQASPGYDFDVNGQVRVQDKLRVGTVNSGNGVVHMSSSATINPNTTTIVWAQNVSVGMCAFIEYYILNNNSLTDQRAGTIMVTWNQSGTPTIAHTETTTPDIGSTTSINFTSSLVGADARINAVNSSANPYTIVMSYKYF